MFIWDWFVSFLDYLGFHRKSGKLIFIGLEDAGKTTLLHMLKNNRMTVPSPTLYPTSEEFIIGNISLTTFDLGGHKQVRRVWKDYFPVIDGIVFLIDVSNINWLNESKIEFESIMAEEQLLNCPILLLGNKIDKTGALGEDQIRHMFNLNGLTTGKENKSRSELNTRPIELFMCSINERQGYGEGLKWLIQYI